ncbi:MAG TPA: hypothetical protein VFN56_04400, partial [Candidatus Saccharimonadales bacterium]|nr:hypothetical protein [Candidatus Saccharimonadales bacterium]
RGQVLPVIKGCVVGVVLSFKKIGERRAIQQSRIVTNEYLWKIIVHDLPPNATNLRSLRSIWHKLNVLK